MKGDESIKMWYSSVLQLLDGMGAQPGGLLWPRGLHRAGDMHLLPLYLHPAAATPRKEV